MEKLKCSLCGLETETEDLVYLPLYVNGSEGIYACLPCRILLTQFATALQSTANKVKINTIKKMKIKEK